MIYIYVCKTKKERKEAEGGRGEELVVCYIYKVKYTS